jgi:hypothetical protein
MREGRIAGGGRQVDVQHAELEAGIRVRALPNKRHQELFAAMRLRADSPQRDQMPLAA